MKLKHIKSTEFLLKTETYIKYRTFIETKI